MKPYYDSEAGQIYNGDSLDILKTLPDESIHCCVTSPPYWGLRDYGVSGQIGLEKTPDEYVSKMVEVFGEVKRVLRDDGTLFLNLGDSYFGSGGAHAPEHANPGLSKSSTRGGVQRVNLYGTSDKALEGFQDHGCLCGSLCDVCRQVYQIHKFHNNSLLVSMLIASLSLSNQGNMVFENDHFPTWDFSLLENHILAAIRDQKNSSRPGCVQPLSSQESMLDGSFQQLLALCLQRDNSSSCLLCGRSLIGDVQKSEYMSDELLKTLHCKSGNVSPCEKQSNHNQYIDKACEYCISYKPQRTINNKTCKQLKPKDLVGIPWRIAFALQADGWYLRQDIIWSKNNPMPESVKDRCTKSHEYIFLLSKSQKYYFDQDAIKEDVGIKGNANTFRGGAYCNGNKDNALLGKRTVSGNTKIKIPTGGDVDSGEHGKYHRKGRGTTQYKTYGKHSTTDKQSPGRRIVENVKKARAEGADHDSPFGNKRNKRSVWTIATYPYKKAHFATFPPKLIEPCILAGCPKNGVVLDPFFGSGTTGIVAYKHDRKFIGIELSEKYLTDIAVPRIKQETAQMKLFA